MNVDYYNQNRGIYSPLMEFNGMVIGFWMCGQNYRNPSRLYGAYPPSYLKRMYMLFHEEYESGRILHLFSGLVTKEKDSMTTLDIRPDFKPDIVANAEDIPLDNNSFDLIFADPPYGKNYEKYGTEPVNKKKVIRECARLLRDGRYLIWLDSIMPLWRKADGWRLRGTVGLLQSTNHTVRVATILRKENEQSS